MPDGPLNPEGGGHVTNLLRESKYFGDTQFILELQPPLPHVPV